MGRTSKKSFNHIAKYFGDLYDFSEDIKNRLYKKLRGKSNVSEDYLWMVIFKELFAKDIYHDEFRMFVERTDLSPYLENIMEIITEERYDSIQNRENLGYLIHKLNEADPDFKSKIIEIGDFGYPGTFIQWVLASMFPDLIVRMLNSFDYIDLFSPNPQNLPNIDDPEDPFDDYEDLYYENLAYEDLEYEGEEFEENGVYNHDILLFNDRKIKYMVDTCFRAIQNGVPLERKHRDRRFEKYNPELNALFVKLCELSIEHRKLVVDYYFRQETDGTSFEECIEQCLKLANYERLAEFVTTYQEYDSVMLALAALEEIRDLEDIYNPLPLLVTDSFLAEETRIRKLYEESLKQ